MLNDYKKHGTSWSEYEEQFFDLMAHRQVESTVSPEMLENSVLLCSEAQPQHCHRRLVAEYLAARWDNVNVEHLV